MTAKKVSRVRTAKGTAASVKTFPVIDFCFEQPGAGYKPKNLRYFIGALAPATDKPKRTRREP